MKIAFFSETQANQKYPRDFPNVSLKWNFIFPESMCHLTQLPDEQFDLGIVIIPKNNPNVDFNHIRQICNKVSVMKGEVVFSRL